MAEPGLVTEIIVLPGDPNLREVRVGVESVASLPERDIERLGLAVGVPWSQAMAARVATALAHADVRKIALKLLGHRNHPAASLRARLVTKGIDDGLAAAVTEELVTDGWIDDRAFAEQEAARLLRQEPAAAVFVQQALERKGIDAKLAEDVAKEVTADRDPQDAAHELARLRFRSSTATAGRIASALTRRGFDEDCVRTALEQLGLLTDTP